MAIDRFATAHALVQLFPGLIGTFRAGLRCSGLNVDPAQFRLLAMIGHRTWHLTELAGFVGVTPATMSNSIDTLVERGRINRNPGTEDRRRVRLEITDQGRETMLLVHRSMETQFADRLKGMSDQELLTIQEGIALLKQVFLPGNPVEIPCRSGSGLEE
jgi:DNA-binding MarR family transcriptional regulator